MIASPQDCNKLRDLPGTEILAAILQLGPFGNLTVALRCEGCEKESEHTLDWYRAHELRCPCGGKFSAEPLRVALRTLQNGQ